MKKQSTTSLKVKVIPHGEVPEVHFINDVLDKQAHELLNEVIEAHVADVVGSKLLGESEQRYLDVINLRGRSQARGARLFPVKATNARYVSGVNLALMVELSIHENGKGGTVLLGFPANAEHFTDYMELLANFTHVKTNVYYVNPGALEDLKTLFPELHKTLKKVRKYHDKQDMRQQPDDVAPMLYSFKPEKEYARAVNWIGSVFVRQGYLVDFVLFDRNGVTHRELHFDKEGEKQVKVSIVTDSSGNWYAKHAGDDFCYGLTAFDISNLLTRSK